MATRGQNSLPNSSGESFDPDVINTSKMASFEVTNVWQSLWLDQKVENNDYTFSSIIYDHQLLNHMN